MKLKDKFNGKTIIVDGEQVFLDTKNVALMQRLSKRTELAVYFEGAKLAGKPRIIGGAKLVPKPIANTTVPKEEEKPQENSVPTRKKVK